MKSKSDYATSYAYGNSGRTTRNGGPHAVISATKVAAAGGGTATFAYDANGNMISGDGRTIAFDLMDRPVQVVQNGTTDFAYAPDGARYRERISGAVSASYGPKTVYSVDKDYELTVWGNGTIEERSYLGSVVVFRQNGGLREVRYQHLDRLGSPDAVTRDEPSAGEGGGAARSGNREHTGRRGRSDTERSDPDPRAHQCSGEQSERDGSRELGLGFRHRSQSCDSK